jgi:hypothetical protein
MGLFIRILKGQKNMWLEKQRKYPKNICSRLMLAILLLASVITLTACRSSNIKETTKEKLEVLPNQPAIEDIKEKAEENDLGESIVTDVLADSIAESLDSHGLTTILKASEVIEGMENFTQNTNINVSKTEITEDDLEKLINEVSNNKNKEKSR